MGGVIRRTDRAVGWEPLAGDDRLPLDCPYYGELLHAISGSRANTVWAVGDAGTIVHWDGESWMTAAL